MSRPPLKSPRDEKARRKVVEVLRAGGSVSGAAKAAGITRQAIYNWRDRGDEEIAALMTARRAAGPIRGARPKNAPAPIEPEGLRDKITGALLQIAQDPAARAQDRLRASLELAKLLPKRAPPPVAPEPAAPPVDVSTDEAPPAPPADPTARFR